MKRVFLSKYSITNFITYTIIAVSTFSFILSLDFSNANYILVFCLLLIGVISFFNIIACKKNVSIRRTIYIFIYFFCFMAPIQQYTSGTTFWKSTGLKVMYTDKDYLRAAIAVLIYILFFEIGYRFQILRLKKGKQETVGFNVPRYFKSNTFNILLLVSTISFLILLGTNNITESNRILSRVEVDVQFINVLRYTVVCSLLVALVHCKRYGYTNKIFYVLVIGVETLVIFFPFWGSMPRYILLGTYVVFYSFFFSKSRYKSMYFLIFFLGFGFTFSGIRSSDSIHSIMNDVVFNFNHVDFDAFQMLMGCFKYVEKNGVCYGKNIISALLFLLPRSIWKGKMENTGSLIARYFGSWHENVSAPIVAEFYFVGGWLAIILLSIMFGEIIKKMDAFDNDEYCFKKIVFCLFAGMMIYMQRGSLLATFAFTGGLLVATLFVNILCRVRMKLT